MVRYFFLLYTIVVYLPVKGQEEGKGWLESNLIISVNNRPCLYQKVLFVKYCNDMPVDTLFCRYNPGSIHYKKAELFRFNSTTCDSTVLSLNYSNQNNPNDFSQFEFSTDIGILKNSYNILNFIDANHLEGYDFKTVPKSGYLVEFWLGKMYSFDPRYLKF
jgi:hypothetical protein